MSGARRPARPAAKLGRPVRAEGGRRTKERILDAAIELFSERGFDRTTLRQIAGAVGLTEAAIYKHYESKSAILDEIIDFLERAVSAPPPPPGGAGTGDASIFAILLGPLPAIAADPRLLRISRIMYAELHRHEKLRSFMRTGLGELAVEALEGIFRAEGERGALRPCDYRSLARVFNAFRTEWIFETFVLDRREGLDPARLEEGLRAAIAFFDGAFLAGRSPA